jgi:hypothetical protein
VGSLAWTGTRSTQRVTPPMYRRITSINCRWFSTRVTPYPDSPSDYSSVSHGSDKAVEQPWDTFTGPNPTDDFASSRILGLMVGIRYSFMMGNQIGASWRGRGICQVGCSVSTPPPLTRLVAAPRQPHQPGHMLDLILGRYY